MIPLLQGRGQQPWGICVKCKHGATCITGYATSKYTNHVKSNVTLRSKTTFGILTTCSMGCEGSAQHCHISGRSLRGRQASAWLYTKYEIFGLLQGVSSAREGGSVPCRKRFARCDCTVNQRWTVKYCGFSAVYAQPRRRKLLFHLYPHRAAP